MQVDGGGERLGAEDGSEDAESNVGALDEEAHRESEDDVGGCYRAAAAQEPVEAAAEEEGDGCADEWPAEEAHGGAGEIEEVAEGEDVGVGIFVEEVGELHVGIGSVGDDCEGERDDGDEDADDEVNRGGNAAGPGDV